MINFDKQEIKEQIKLEQIYELLEEWGGEPQYTAFGILSRTICHHTPGEGNYKLYYYEANNMFYCYSNCGSFDIFDLTIKVMEIQKNKKFDLNDAVRALAYRFNIIDYIQDEDKLELEDWAIFNRYDRINEIEIKDYTVSLKEYDDTILSRFNYKVKLTPWLNEGISQEAIELAQIGFYPGGDQITIPHFDANGRLIGVRGRTLNKEEAELYGKYRPIKITDTMYTHPLGMNLYGLNWAKENIKTMQKAIVFESEKSVLKYISCFGKENDIAVACCGSSISTYQIHMLLAVGAKEIIVAFDHDFEELGDQTHKRQIANFRRLHNKFKNYVNITFINDKRSLTGHKDSPIDCGREIFLKLFKERVVL